MKAIKKIKKLRKFVIELTKLVIAIDLLFVPIMILLSHLLKAIQF